MNKTFIQVHVGKTGGTFTQKYFRLRNITVQEIHIFELTQKPSDRPPMAHGNHFPIAVDRYLIAPFDYILLNLRDPFERTVSAYHFCAQSARSNMKYFPTFEEYAGNLTENTVMGQAARAGECHVAWNTCAFLGGAVDDLKIHGNVFVTLQATCEEDLNNILKTVGLHNISPNQNHSEFLSKSSRVVVSPEAKRNVVEYLERIGEYDLYRRLVELFHKKKPASKYIT